MGPEYNGPYHGRPDGCDQHGARRNVLGRLHRCVAFRLHHVAQVLAYSGNVKIDYALFNPSPISAEMRDRYATENATALPPPALIP